MLLLHCLKEENQIAKGEGEMRLVVSKSILSWILEISDSYEEDEMVEHLITALSISPGSKPPYSLSKGILRYKGRVYTEKKL